MGLLGIAFGAIAASMLGGLAALRLRDTLHLILGFSAGAVIGVAFFDLLPEAFSNGAAYGPRAILIATAVGFLAYLLLDRLLVLHRHAHEAHDESARAHLRAGSLSIHSLLDGIGIGLGFQVSPAVGFVIAVAVLTHDFSDGINTVSVALRHGLSREKAFRWLVVDAVAPAIGIACSLAITVSASVLGLLLALFAGFFLYIGASDLVPESHHAHPTFWTTALTVIGAGVLYGAVALAGI
jgi:ZIP family zinc transporter